MPATITFLSPQQFKEQAWKLVGRKVNKTALLTEIYATAQCSIGVPVELDSFAVAMFRLVLEEFLELSRSRDCIASRAAHVLADSIDGRRLMTIPGIGPAIALVILAEARTFGALPIIVSF
jgi:hypothetical protein